MLKSFFIVGSRPGFLLAVETRRDTQILPFYHFMFPHCSLSDAFGETEEKFRRPKELDVFLVTLLWELIRIPAPQQFPHTCDAAAAASESFSGVASLVRVTVLCLSSGP